MAEGHGWWPWLTAMAWPTAMPKAMAKPWPTAMADGHDMTQPQPKDHGHGRRPLPKAMANGDGR